MRIDRKNVFFVLLIAMFFCVSLFSLHTETLAEPPSNFHEENAGSEETPFLIANLANLRWLSETPDVWGFALLDNNWEVYRYYFLQTADIDASETINWNEGKGFHPIGNYFEVATMNAKVLSFLGIYDGDYHKISNLHINTPDELYYHEGYFDIPAIVHPALFGYLDFATIKNLRVENATVKLEENRTYQSYIGVLVGCAFESKIENCKVSGELLVGTSYPEISITSIVGSLVGNAQRSHIEYCYSKVTIYDFMSETSSLGGIIGYTGQTTLKNSFFYGDIFSSIERERNGGLIGSMSLSDVQFCYVVSYTDFQNISGLIGRISSSQNPSNIRHNFWNTETTGVLEPFNLVEGQNHTINNNFGLTTLEMKQNSTFINNDWDLENIWWIDERLNNGYPFLRSMDNKRKAPVDFTGKILDHDVVLTWLKSDFSINYDSNIQASLNGFILYRNHIFVNQTTDMNYIDLNLDTDTKYSYWIIAYYDDGEFGSAGTSIIMPLFSPPLNLQAIAGDGVVNLSWEIPNTQKYGTVIGYNVFRDDKKIDVILSPYKEYSDIGLENDIYYEYHVTAIWGGEIDGESEPSNIVIAKPETSDENDEIISYTTLLLGNFPNPFNPQTTINFSLARNGFVSIEIFNIRGQRIITLINNLLPAGKYEIFWTGVDSSNLRVSSGIYFYTMVTEDYNETRRMILLR
ncbi:MAG: T9SS type A sorting domain-containing protein [Candidatus Cloacimonetes bacterium]|nr:T9SS type A sorting domain-containing protein [Candidatus Cloacimonadota bacterium]